jgi:hypothetical protein
MTFTKTSNSNWEASKENRTFYIDRETNGKYSMYYLTVLENSNVILQGSDFFKLNEAKQFAKQY